MSITRLIRSAGVLLAVAVLAALANVGIAVAYGGHAVTASATAQPGSAVKAAGTGCPSPPPGPRPSKGGTAAPDGKQMTASAVPTGLSHGSPPSGLGAKPGASPLPCAWSLLAKAK